MGDQRATEIVGMRSNQEVVRSDGYPFPLQRMTNLGRGPGCLLRPIQHQAVSQEVHQGRRIVIPLPTFADAESQLRQDDGGDARLSDRHSSQSSLNLRRMVFHGVDAGVGVEHPTHQRLSLVRGSGSSMVSGKSAESRRPRAK
jgi:hypothetical protein